MTGEGTQVPIDAMYATSGDWGGLGADMGANNSPPIPDPSGSASGLAANEYLAGVSVVNGHMQVRALDHSAQLAASAGQYQAGETVNAGTLGKPDTGTMKDMLGMATGEIKDAMGLATSVASTVASTATSIGGALGNAATSVGSTLASTAAKAVPAQALAVASGDPAASAAPAAGLNDSPHEQLVQLKGTR